MTENTPETVEPPVLPPVGMPAAETAMPPPESPADAPPDRRLGVLGALCAVGFAALAVGLIWLWVDPPYAVPPGLSAEIVRLRQDVDNLQARLTRLEKQPAQPESAPVDLAPLTARVAALEARHPPAPVDLGPLESKVAQLAARPVGDPALTARVEALSARVEALSGHVDSTDTAIRQRQDATEGRLAPLEHDAGQITALADRSARIARIQAAQAALDGGLQLGDIPGAPAALSRYATVAPPTEAGLRLAFPPVANAALAASRPSEDGKPFLDRVWARVQDLVTLRQGDRVILGDPAAGVLARARAALNAGDLAAAKL
jgi:hypothetical protein